MTDAERPERSHDRRKVRELVEDWDGAVVEHWRREVAG
jgi:hypothetical protein